MPESTVNLLVRHKCGCERTIRATGPPPAISAILRQLETENCGQVDCPKRRHRNLRAPVRG